MGVVIAAQSRTDCQAIGSQLSGLATFQVGNQRAAGANEVVRCDWEHVVPGSRRRPHFVVLQQVGVNEHTQLSCVTKRRHATDGVVVGFETTDRQVRYRLQAAAMASNT